MYTDSVNARANVINSLNSARTRCINIRYKWVIQKVREKIFNVQYIPGENIVIDGLTKPLNKDKYQKFVKLLGLVKGTVPWTK